MRIPKRVQQENTVATPLRDPAGWLPPASVIDQLANKLVDCQIKYLFTAGDSADTPDFLLKGCLQRSRCGDIEYNLGTDAHKGNVANCLTIPEQVLLTP